MRIIGGLFLVKREQILREAASLAIFSSVALFLLTVEKKYICMSTEPAYLAAKHPVKNLTIAIGFLLLAAHPKNPLVASIGSTRHFLQINLLLRFCSRNQASKMRVLTELENYLAARPHPERIYWGI